MNEYAILSIAQSVYSRYLQIRTQLTSLDNNFKTLCHRFDAFPTQQNLDAVLNAWNQRYNLMQQIPQVVNDLVYHLTTATNFALLSMQSSIAANNKLRIVLNDNAIASIYSQIELYSHQLNIKELYKQNCLVENIHKQLNDIEMRAIMMKLSIPNFDRLKVIIRGY